MNLYGYITSLFNKKTKVKTENRTWIKMQFHGETEPIEVDLPTYVVNMWIEEKKPLASIRRNATILEFRNYNKELP